MNINYKIHHKPTMFASISNWLAESESAHVNYTAFSDVITVVDGSNRVTLKITVLMHDNPINPFDRYVRIVYARGGQMDHFDNVWGSDKDIYDLVTDILGGIKFTIAVKEADEYVCND